MKTSGATSRIPAIFKELRELGHKGLMPFICAGRPSMDALPDVLRAAQEAGGHIVEVGFPFSDPIADGPVIAAAMHEALTTGVTPQQIFDEVARVRSELDIGLIAMVSVSIVHRMGAERFVNDATAAGFDGFIFPDAPVDEARSLVDCVESAGRTVTLLAAPTSPDDRLRRICDMSSGFVYLLARLGVTGEQTVAPTIEPHVRRLRSLTDLPIACGFGISTAAHVRDIVAHADAAIVGSALVRRIERAFADKGEDAAVDAVHNCVSELAEGLS